MSTVHLSSSRNPPSHWSIAGALFGIDALVVAAVSMALGAAFLNAAFNFCLGCEIYLLLLRARSK